MPTPFDFAAPDAAFDLTNLALVKQVAQCGDPTNTTGDTALQMLITSVSHEWLKWTGHTQGGVEPASSPFLSIQGYDEWYDGNGNEQLFLRTWPIRTVSLLTVNGLSIPVSTDTSTMGYVIAGDLKSLVMRSVGASSGYFAATNWRQRGFNTAPGFSAGTQNVHVVSTRGFSSPPADVIRAVTQIVIANSNRAPMEGVLSQSTSVAGRSGSISYAGWAVPPQCRFVIQAYACSAL